MRGLAIVHECVTLAHSERIGLRYLDAVVPPGGETGLAEYLAPGVLGLSSRLPEDVTVSHSFSETHIKQPSAPFSHERSSIWAAKFQWIFNPLE